KDKTVIHFDDGITGIVGPNGCGKSNVVDAFFWVMGEQNARHLRGQSMDDLIFSGADKAAPASFAEVTLVLEMPGEISGPNAASGASSSDVGANPATLPTREVSITRKLYRSGESDYSLNKTPCRLKDIQELFMDTGVGSRGYSIIQQGQIAKIVQAKPEDRRQMIEEVAGIVKYKVRRKESMRKLEGTQQNLLRVTDVINELDTQKRMMERQAEKARKYKEWKEKLQDIELRFNTLKWEDHSNRIGSLEQDLDVLGEEDTALSTARETAETQIAQKRMELAQASKVAEEFQTKWMEAGTTLNNAENDLKYSQKNLADIQASFGQLERDTEEERVLVESLAATQEELNLEAATIEEQFASADAHRQEQEDAATAAKRQTEEIDRNAEAARKRLYQSTSEIDKARNASSYAEQRLLELDENVSRLANERAERDEFLASALGEKDSAAELVQSARDEAEALRGRVQEAAEESSQAGRTLQEQRREVASLTSEQARLRTTLKTLEDQKLRHEDASKGVKALFQQILPKRADLKSAVQGTLADLLSVDAGMETAAEAALGKSMELVITHDASVHASLSAALKEAKSGRATFADVQRLGELNAGSSAAAFSAPADKASAVRGPLANFVRLTGENAESARALLAHLLDGVIAVETAEAASALSGQFPEHSFVTLQGEIFRGGWFMEGGDQSSVSGAFVGRNREISELGEKLEEIGNALDVANATISEMEERLQSLEVEKRAAEDSLRAKQSEIAQLASEEGSLNARVAEAQKAMGRFAQEEERLSAEQARLHSTREEAAEKIALLELDRDALDTEAANFSEILIEARTNLDIAQSALMEARLRAAKIEEQKRTIVSRRQRNQNSLDQHRTRVENMLEQARKRQAEAESTTERISEIEESLGDLRSTMVDAEANFRAAKDRFDVLNNEVEEQRSAVQEHGSRERMIKETLLNKRLELQRLTGDRDALAQNTFERYGITLSEYSMMPETMEQVQVLREAGEGMIKEIHNEVMLLKEKIRKLGDVNPGAVEEYEGIVDRFNLLSAQKADLEKAMKDLQSTVDRINEVSRDRFERAFTEVNANFKRVFPIIFGGGHAHLTLTNPEDMLETGVDITAQPPGKKPQNINLLSGGEKTLTAISLLFSIFLVKPSPFCLLDEVDAPLDDANIGRFNALLREMAKRSQFIIITHNKRTMELNDKLYGVTMEEAGMSKMVSILL
ncbi:MAG: chromosome segregation protein SMC, partial [Proteobacteria bacterium]